MTDTHPATSVEETQSVTTRDQTQVQQENYPDNPEQSNVATNLSIQETRQQLVSLYIRGDSTDARALFSAAQGATEAGWTNFERVLSPVKDFVLMGNLPYSNVEWTGEYSGVGDARADMQEAGGQPVIGDGTQETVNPQMDSPMQPVGSAADNVDTPEPQTDEITDTSAQALIARARAAEDAEELDAIESLSNGRVTVLDAVDARREELGITA